MAAIYLRHPKHGTKTACLEQEALYDEGLGWVRYTPDTAPKEPVSAPKEPVPATEIQVEKPTAFPYPTKVLEGARGRKRRS